MPAGQVPGAVGDQAGEHGDRQRLAQRHAAALQRQRSGDYQCRVGGDRQAQLFQQDVEEQQEQAVAFDQRLEFMHVDSCPAVVDSTASQHNPSGERWILIARRDQKFRCNKSFIFMQPF
ncbi:hypothetical protein D3C78_1278360 [compost metagenome]